MGLALGAKFTAGMMLPGFALGLGFVFLTRRPRPLRMMAIWSGACLAGFVLLGAFNYAQTWLFYKAPLGSANMVSRMSNRGQVGLGTLVRSNVARDIYSLMDFAGVPKPLAWAGVNARAKAGAAAFKLLRVPTDSPALNRFEHAFTFKKPRPEASEAGSFFGPLGFFLWLPLILYWSVAGFIKRDGRLMPALAFLGFLLVMAGSQAWLPFRGRLYCGVIALCAPLTAAVFRSGRRLPIGRGLIILAACTFMAVTAVTNVQKPLLGDKSIWGKAYEERRFTTWSPSQMAYRRLCQAVPPGATVADIMKFQDLEYILFGEDLTHTVVPIYPPPDIVDLKWLEAHPYPYLLVHSTGVCPVAELPAERFRVLTGPPYKLIIRRDEAQRP
jgi:hypothetical protein